MAMQLRVTGLRGILLLLVLAGVFAFRTATARSDLEQGAAEQLQQWLRAEYTRQQLSTVSGVQDLTQEKVDSLLATANVTFSDIRAKGAPDDMVVRVKVLVAGGPPADGKSVRYYRMKHSLVTGWHMQREVSALSYYTRIF